MFLGQIAGGLYLYATIIPSGRLMTWQGNVGVPGGTAPTEQAYTSLTSSATHTDIETAINNASTYAAAHGNVQQVVTLGAGTYTLGGTIRTYAPKYVTVRGAGVGSTILTGGTFSQGTSPWIDQWPTGTTVVSGATQGSTQIVVTSAAAAALTVGEIFVIETANTTAVFGYGNGGGTTQTGNSAGRLRDGANVKAQRLMVTVIASNTITFSPALNDAFVSASVYGVNGVNGPTHCGLENLTINYGSDVDSYGYYTEGAYACWAKNIEVTNWGSYNSIANSVSCEFRDSYIHDPNTFSVNHGYALQFDNVNNTLVENCVFYKNQENFLMQKSSSGNVIGYNAFFRTYDVYNGITVQQAAVSGNHTAYPWLNLYEGNYFNSINSDFYYGPSAFGTVFRNYIAGTDPDVTQNRITVNLSAHQLNYNVVGNILGTTGTSPSNQIVLALPSATLTYANTSSLTWTYGATSQNNFATSQSNIYRLGYPNIGNNASTGWTSAPSSSTQLDYGDTDVQAMAASPAGNGNYTLITANWDKANAAVTYDSSIADHSPVNSYYLAGKPSWFGSLTWPCFDPSNGEAANPSTALQLLPAGYRLVTGAAPSSAGGSSLSGNATIKGNATIR